MTTAVDHERLETLLQGGKENTESNKVVDEMLTSKDECMSVNHIPDGESESKQCDESICDTTGNQPSNSLNFVCDSDSGMPPDADVSSEQIGEQSSLAGTNSHESEQASDECQPNSKSKVGQSDCDTKDASDQQSHDSLDANGAANVPEVVPASTGTNGNHKSNDCSASESILSGKESAVLCDISKEHPLPAVMTKHQKADVVVSGSRASRTASSKNESNRNPELLAALLKPEHVLSKSDSLKTVVNTMVEVSMWMPLNEAGEQKNKERTLLMKGMSNSNSEASNCESGSTNGHSEHISTKDLESSAEMASRNLDSEQIENVAVTSSSLSEDSINSASTSSALKNTPTSSTDSHSAATDMASANTICTVVIRTGDKKSPIVVWATENEMTKTTDDYDSQEKNPVLKSADGAKANSPIVISPEGDDDDEACFVADEGNTTNRNIDSSLDNVEVEHTSADAQSPVSEAGTKSPGRDVVVSPVVITPISADREECIECYSDAQAMSSVSLPQITQVYGGITGNKLRQLHTEGSISSSNQNSHSLLKSILKSASKIRPNVDSTTLQLTADKSEGQEPEEVNESSQEQQLLHVAVKEEKNDPGYGDVPPNTKCQQVFTKVTHKKTRQSSGTAQPKPGHHTSPSMKSTSRKPLQNTAAVKNVEAQLVDLAGLLQTSGTGATTVILPNNILPTASGIIGMMAKDKGKNIQIAVPVVLSKAGEHMAGPAPVIFTLASMPKGSAVETTTSTPTVSTVHASTSSVVKPKSSTSSKIRKGAASVSKSSVLEVNPGMPIVSTSNITPKVNMSSKSKSTASVSKSSTLETVTNIPVVSTGQESSKCSTSPKAKTAASKPPLDSSIDCDYNRFLRNMLKVKKEVKELESTDAKYVCLMPPPTLFLSHRMNRMFVCRGCDSIFHKQSSLSEHQLRRTLTVRYSCQPNCHVLFYNICQLILHMRTHPVRSDWQNKVEISGLPEELLCKLPAPKGETYAEVKQAIYTEAGMADKLLANDKDGRDSETSAVDLKLEQVSPAGTGEDNFGRLEKQKRRKSRRENSPLEQRINTLAGENPVICTECGLMLKTRTELKIHMNSGESKKIAFFCKTCPVVVWSKCAQSAHARIHKNSLPYVCPECGQVIHGSHNVFWKHLHVKCAHHIRQVLFVCKFCKKEYVEPKKLVTHTINHHSTKFHKCQLCPMAFKVQSGVVQHAKSNHNGNVSQKIIFRCPFCVAVYKEDTYTSHLEQHVNETDFVVYRCNACSKLYKSHSDCRTHMTQVHKFYFNNREMCHVCGVEVRKLSKLRMHQITEHPNLKQLDEALTRCLKRSGIIAGNESGSLSSVSPAVSPGNKDKQHSDKLLTVFEAEGDLHREIKQEEDETKLSCDRCQMMLLSTEAYQRHMAKHQFIQRKRMLNMSSNRKLAPTKRSGGSLSDAVLKIKLPKLGPANSKDDKPFTKQVPGAPDPEPQLYCTECNRAFYLDEDLARHMKKEHNQERQFPCHLCGKTYYDQASLKSHLKQLHEGWSRDKPYMCWICQEKDIRRNFPKRLYLIRHISKEHKIARNLIDYSKIPDPNKDLAKAAPSPSQASLGEHDTQSEGSVEKDSPPVKRLKLQGESNFLCAKCSYTTEDRSEFISHIKKHQHSQQNDSKLCLECGLGFTVMQSLKRHLLVVHHIRDFNKYLNESGLDLLSQPEEEVTLPEDMANPQPDRISKPRGFNDSNHHANQCPRKEKSDKLECKVCYKTCKDEPELRTHMRTHGMAYIKSSRRLEDI